MVCSFSFMVLLTANHKRDYYSVLKSTCRQTGSSSRNKRYFVSAHSVRKPATAGKLFIPICIGIPSPHSVRSDFTGFAIAALIAWKLMVTNAITAANKPAAIKTHQ